jgi:metallo-beta-lactamase family protein
MVTGGSVPPGSRAVTLHLTQHPAPPAGEGPRSLPARGTAGSRDQGPFGRSTGAPTVALMGDERSAAPTLTFLGATGTVTGSRFLLEAEGLRILVDCGLFQGPKELRLRNWAPFPVSAATIDAVVLSHAHVDHCGYLPALVRDGFRGPVVASRHTTALAAIVLPDSGRLNEEEAAYANRKGFSKHRPARPLFTEEDAGVALERFVSVPFDAPYDLGRGIEVRMGRTPHILGAASPHLTIAGGRSVLFSGDLGRPDHPFLAAGDRRAEADVVICESTYGDRTHADVSATVDQLAETVRRTAQRGGVVVIPAFAVDRTEVLLLQLRRLIAEGSIPELPVYLDSPMASAALSVYRDAALAGADDIRLEHRGTDPFDVPGLREVRAVAASMELNELRGPMIVISASGMITGGRVVHHVAHRLGDDRNAIVLVGYQAVGTRGRLLADGATQVKMLGHYFSVRADVVTLPGLSVHADRTQLLAWLSSAGAPEAVYTVHGEPDASASLAAAIRDQGGVGVVPREGERVRLDAPIA